MSNMNSTDQPGAGERCPWCGTAADYQAYHDTVWGRPVRDPLDLFAKLCLDGQQAGLSWITILRKQAHYERLFHGFEPQQMARMTDAELDNCLKDPGIVRNRLKVESLRRNARAYLALAERGENFSQWIWSAVDGRPRQNRFTCMSEIPASTPESEALSKRLRKAGFNFVGPTIVYAFMQAVGMVNDHLVSCPQHDECARLGSNWPEITSS